MAEYGIVMKLGDTIKGNIKVEGYADTIGVLSAEFACAASRTGAGFGAKDSVSVSCAPIQVTIHAGKWTAEIMQNCYNLKKIDQVVLTQLAQSVDKQAKGAPTVLQTMTLSGVRITGVSQTFDNGSDRVAGVTLEYDKILIEIDKKPADFVVRNITTGAH